MPLAAGTRLGLYEIVASLGAGGMGRVLVSVPVTPEPAPQVRVILNFGRELERRFSGR